MVLVSTGGQARLIWYPFRTHDFNKYVNTSHNLVTAAWHDGTCKCRARALGYESAQELQVVSGRKAKSHGS